MSTAVRQVLFLCTHNAARSIMAEALLNACGDGCWVAHSAGSSPGPAPHPLALETLRNLGVATTGLRSKPWDEFAHASAPPIDLVITVCDDAAGEACPVWPGRPATAHWGIADPSRLAGGEDQRRLAFAAAAAILQRRIGQLVALADLDPPAFQVAVRAIGAE